VAAAPTKQAALGTPSLDQEEPEEGDLDEEVVEATGKGEDAQAEGYPFLEELEEEPLVSEELPAANPDEVLRSGSAEADRLKRQAQAIQAEIKHDVSFDIPIVLNERVAYFMDYFQTVARERFGTWLARSTKYIPRMQEILRQQGLPEDLVYLALIESGFNPRAVSRSAAVGPWQFISATGSRYGLKQDRWVDERRDPEKATFAAAAYLTDLYREFGSWYLAAAAYNCGEGRIRRAIRDHNTVDYWEICDQQAIARETRDYVPQMIAAILIAKEPGRYGFADICYETPPEWETATLERPTDLRLVAELCGSELQQVKDLNPELRLNWTPPVGGASYQLRVPRGSREQFLARLAEHREQLASSLIEHRVRRGETLNRIARRYGCSVYELAAANDLSPKSRVRRGQRLAVPISLAELEARAFEAAGRPEKFCAPKTHTVRRGDNLHRIAKRYGISLAELKSLNPRLKKKSGLHPGQQIIVAKGRGSSRAESPAKGGLKKKTHTVEPGETLSQIARRYDTTLGALRDLNPDLDETIQPGQKILVKGRGALLADGPTKGGLKKKTHTVEPGETLSQIARRCDTTLSALRDLNPDLGEVIQPGQEIVVKTGRLVADSGSHRVRSYKVKPGDTLWKIARRYNVEVSDLRDWNGLGKNEAIRPGDRLKLKTDGELGG
jgi:membrane-bound lytic murein transglycosylase D